MIKNFEEYTKPLNEDEKRAARNIFKYLEAHPNDYITNNRLKMKSNIVFKSNDEPLKLTPSRMRKIIAFIHLGGHAPRLVASSKGYKFSGTKQELVDYALSLDQRAQAIAARRDRVQQSINSIKNQ